MAEVTLVEAVTLALARAMDEDPNVVVLGEDVGVNGGVSGGERDSGTGGGCGRIRNPSSTVRSRHWSRRAREDRAPGAAQSRPRPRRGVSRRPFVAHASLLEESTHACRNNGSAPGCSAGGRGGVFCGNGSDRQLRVFNANRDIVEVVREIANATEIVPTPAV